MDTFTARSTVDLLAAVPFLIGFHPEDSVVLMTFDNGLPPRAQCFHARVDLPVTAAGQVEVAAMLRGVVARNRAATVGLILYTQDAAAAGFLADLLITGLLDDEVEVIEAIRADGDCFFVVDDPDDPGTPYDLSTHPFTASQVLRGKVAHPSRAALADSLVGTDEEDTAAIASAATVAADELLARIGSGDQVQVLLVEQARWVHTTVARLLVEPAAPTPSEAARLLVLLSFEPIREVAWTEMTRAAAASHVRLWTGLVRRAPADLRSAVAGILALSAWLAGDGALAWCALDRAAEADPDDPLAQQVAALLESATPPSVWVPTPATELTVLGATGSSEGS